MRVNPYIRFLFASLILGCWSQANALYFQQQDTVKTDTLGPYEPSQKPTFQPSYRFGDPFSFRSSRSPLFLRDPSQLDMQVQFNPDTTADDAGITYSVYENIGSLDFRPASFMTFQEFNRYNNSQLNREYFKEKSVGLDGESAVSGRSLIPRLYISPVFDRIFGGSYVDIQPNGFVNLDFGARFQRIDNPAIPLRQQKNGAFNFDQQISMNVVGKVGEKLAITANFDNNNSFDFQNNLKVEYTGYEEDIIKKIEIGNVSMPVSNSLIRGAQSLFGIKTELQFGKLYVTTVLSQQRGRNESITFENGQESNEGSKIPAVEYDENRHYFLGHFFRENYEKSLKSGQQISSGVQIRRVEVYVVGGNKATENLRNIAAIMDLGEGSRIYREGDPGVGTGNGGPTRNGANSIFSNLPASPISKDEVGAFFSSTFPTFESEIDYENKPQARKLEEGVGYELNEQLGYISLNSRLSTNEVLAVAYEYTFDGKQYKVGELSEDYINRSDDKVIFLKLLRPNGINASTDLPAWDLMMKNIYNIGGYNIVQEGFELSIIYEDDETQQYNPYLSEGSLKDIPLVQVLDMDRFGRNGDYIPDGNFDFINGVTINTQTGLVIFPVVEPFGKDLEEKFENNETTLKQKYVFNEMYEEVKVDAKNNYPTKNKFFLNVKFSGQRSCTQSLRGINIAEGSVQVTQGGRILNEGTDYTVDYQFGTVTLSEAVCNAGDVRVDFEPLDLFNFQTRTLTGARFDYRFNQDFNIGATVLHLNERPGGITRFAIGNEPARNTKYGFDINYQNDSRFLTKMVDAIPLVNTKEPSTVTINAEFAQLIPGTSNQVNGEGISYIDDFENAATPINIMGWQAWRLGSTPSGDYPEWNSQSLDNRYRSAKIAWYTVDNSIFYRAGGNNRPGNISDTDLENHYERSVLPQEIFRQRDQNLVNFNEPIFDVAYFPSERGQYNYNPATNPDNTLPNPEQNYGAITRAITSQSNFSNNNIEYIEFWLMDPFIDGDRGRVLDGRLNQNNTTGGELIFNLGSVSEDIARDDRHAFENGLSANGEFTQAELNSDWGRITEDEPLINFFENSPGARENQDIGLDGLKDEDEQDYFTNLSSFDDPSADNFRYILDPFYDQLDAKIVQRYKDWNGMENNSPTSTSAGQSFIPSSTNLPDNENINIDIDNDVSSREAYYEYRIDLDRGNNPNGGNLLSNYIVDQIESGNGESTWYQFRIPINDNPDVVGDGNISFNSIKFIRMYLTGWQQPVVLRFAQFRLVGNQWRKVKTSLQEPGLNPLPEEETSDFNVSVVNIEENSTTNSGGTRYVLPPGFNRDIDNTTTQNRRINEQSLQLCVEDLEDKDSRAVLKAGNAYDLINYGRLQMFLHAEAYNNQMLLDDEVSAFIRLGRDESSNYYEIEVPLKVTPPNLTGSDEEIRRLVWPLENEIDVSLDELIGVKSERNNAKIEQDRLFSVPSNDGRYKFTILGNPNLSEIKVLMIGVRNPGDASGSPKSVCIWANELRVTDFDRNAGWAANARISTKLADLGTISATTQYTTIGFGGIQDKISERSREETKLMNVSANLNLEKFMRPDKTGLVIPMYVSYENTTSRPQFDPLNPDVPLEASLAAIDDSQERERYRKIVTDRTTRRSINFTNVRKEKVNPDAVRRVYDIENFSFSYAYSDRVTNNVYTAVFLNKSVSGGLTYNYSPTAGTVEPFKNSEKLTSPYLAMIKDVNFTFLPSNLTFSTNLRRDFTLRQYYDDQLQIENVKPLYEKNFTFSRNYGFRWDFTKSLGLTYSATANAVIDEPLDRVEGDIDTKAEKSFIWDQILNLGRLKNFNQNIQLNYALPLSKIPFTDWLSADARYSVGYGWIAGAIDQGANTPDSLIFGNFINNQRTIGLTSRADINKLYDKVTFLKNAKAPPAKDETVSPGNKALRFLMMLKSVNGTYNINESTSLPGFKPNAFLLGLDSGFNAPGIEFILGSQDPGIKQKAADNGWLVENENLNSPFQQTFGTDIDIKADLEPSKDLRIQLTWNRGLNNSYQEVFRFDGAGGFETLTPSRSGSYSVSFLTIQTAFQRDGAENTSAAFSQFERNIDIIRRRQNEANELTNNNQSLSYDSISQDVLIPAFIAAYSGQDANSVGLTPFPKTPLPNWRVDYTGLIKIPALSEIFSSFTVSHGYNSSYSVSSFTNSLNYDESVVGLQNDILDYPQADTTGSGTGRLVPVYIINQVMISEQFVPLIGFNVRTKSNISTRLEYRKTRNLALNMSNAQVTETTNNDVTLDFGYSKVGFKLPWRFQGRTMTLKNDLTMRVAASVRDSKTVQRRINDKSTVTNGNFSWQVRPTVTYKINNQLDFTFYMERNVTDPKAGNSFKRATSAFGVQLRFGLAQ